MNRLFQRLAAALLLVIITTASALAAVPASTGLVPLRVVAEAARAEIKWDAATQTATITAHDGVVTVVSIGKSTATVDGQEMPVGRTVELVDGKAMIAAPFLNNALGFPVSYNATKDTASVDPQMEQALAFTKAMPIGKALEFRDQFSPALQQAMTPELMGELAAYLAVFGKPGRAIVVGQSYTGVHENIDVVAPFERSIFKVTVRFTPGGQIDDIHVVPLNLAVTAGEPDYADPTSYIEKEVVIGDEAWPLPATLTLPIGKGPFPVVVTVHGSGANDRDETAFGVKVFRDLAHGLASRGIAVLRYDKRTLVHGAKSSLIPRMTLQEETVADALAAVKYLSEQPGIDPSRIFVVGHSQGGYVMPRILEQDAAKLVRGGVMMGAPDDFYRIIVEQNKIMAQNGEAPPGQAAFMEQQLTMLRDPAFNPEQPPEGYLLGAPYYWLDLSPKAAPPLKGQTQPLLILQGQRDFQVQVAEFESFKAELAERTNVTYKLYPKLNHFFTEGEGAMSSMKEYLKPANLPVYVIEDITNWINGL